MDSAMPPASSVRMARRCSSAPELERPLFRCVLALRRRSLFWKFGESAKRVRHHRKFTMATLNCRPMSERIMAQTASDTAPTRRKRRGSLVGRLVRWFFLLTVIFPVVLILLLRFVPPPATPLMIGTFIFDGPIEQRWLPLDAISPNLVRAVIAAEDDKFCSHHGFDMEAIDKAIERNAVSKRLRGASSISQQTAKN